MFSYNNILLLVFYNDVTFNFKYNDLITYYKRPIRYILHNMISHKNNYIYIYFTFDQVLQIKKLISIFEKSR